MGEIMIFEFVSVCIVIFALLAIYLDELIYSLCSLTIMSILMTVLYALNGALNAAIFHITISMGTLIAFFLLGEELNGGRKAKKLSKKSLLILISLPLLSITFSLYPAENYTQFFLCDKPFAQVLWGLRGFDVVLQGIVVLSVALGASIILYEERGKK